MRFECKIALPKELLSEGNKTDHWTKKRKRNQQRDLWLNLYANFDYSKLTLPCNVSITRIAPRNLDYDNWVTTCKHFRDWIANRIIPGLAPGQADNENKGISWYYNQEKGKVKEYGIKIEIF